uniref:Uncharacterized protein n=1 Tax=Hyaloperonospora arabidopsidis (strain Emoy2) TaxID=559515 RepID=M4BLD6_HYAAE
MCTTLNPTVLSSFHASISTVGTQDGLRPTPPSKGHPPSAEIVPARPRTEYARGSRERFDSSHALIRFKLIVAEECCLYRVFAHVDYFSFVSWVKVPRMATYLPQWDAPMVMRARSAGRARGKWDHTP